jgi:type IV secretion system protein VirB10
MTDPAALVTGMNSDLPGPVVAQVTRNVYDSVTQRDVLIPAGTRLVGEYDDQIATGQNRALVAWTQMTFPNGTTVELPGLPGADLEGNAGLSDRVDRHYGRVVGSALLLAAVGAGVEMAAPSNRGIGFDVSPQEVASRQVAIELSRIATETVRQDLRVQPTVRVSPGYRFYVLLARDLPFASPYRARAAVGRFARGASSRR